MESSRVLEQCRDKKIQYLTCLGTTSYSPSDDLEMGKSPYAFSNYYIILKWSLLPVYYC